MHEPATRHDMTKWAYIVAGGVKGEWGYVQWPATHPSITSRWVMLINTTHIMARTRPLNKFEQARRERFLRLVQRQEQKIALADRPWSVDSSRHIPVSIYSRHQFHDGGKLLQLPIVKILKLSIITRRKTFLQSRFGNIIQLRWLQKFVWTVWAFNFTTTWLASILTYTYGNYTNLICPFRYESN